MPQYTKRFLEREDYQNANSNLAKPDLDFRMICSREELSAQNYRLSVVVAFVVLGVWLGRRHHELAARDQGSFT